MRPLRNITLLAIFLVSGILSQISYCRLMQLNQMTAGARKTIIISSDTGGIPFHQSSGTVNSSLRGPLEEDDDDDSAKEKMLHSTTCFLSAFLDQLYSRQHAIFEELYLEIFTPPPQV